MSNSTGQLTTYSEIKYCSFCGSEEIVDIGDEVFDCKKCDNRFEVNEYVKA